MNNYDATHVRMPENLFVMARENMGMFLGGNTAHAIGDLCQRLVLELLEQSPDRPTLLTLTLHRDGSVELLDNGWMPNFRPQFSPYPSAWLYAHIAAALSAHALLDWGEGALEIDGHAQTSTERSSELPEGIRRRSVFWFDSTLFVDRPVPAVAPLHQRLRELAALYPHCHFVLRDESSGAEFSIHAHHGGDDG